TLDGPLSPARGPLKHSSRMAMAPRRPPLLAQPLRESHRLTAQSHHFTAKATEESTGIKKHLSWAAFSRPDACLMFQPLRAGGDRKMQHLELLS
ncbi:hypothetical protein DPEC_G00367420, partial [Dallia pectoralis]